MNAATLEQEECSRSLTSDHEEPPLRSTSPRMKKLLASSKASKHASLQVKRDFSHHGNYYYSQAFLLCRWVNGKRWFMGRQRTSWSWQNRPACTWTLIRHLVLPQEPSCFNAVQPLSKKRSTRPATGSLKRQSRKDKFYFFKHEDTPANRRWHCF